MNSELPVKRLYEVIAFHHLANRTVASAYGTELGLLDSTLMAEIIGDDHLTAVQLAARTLLGEVAISRCLSRMERLRLIKRHKSRLDKRARRIEITSKGKKLFYTAYANAQETFSSAYARVPDDGRHAIGTFMDRFSDDLGCPVAVALPADPPLMQAIRRVTRGIRVLSNRMFGFSELSPVEYHSLRAAEQQRICARDLCQLLAAPGNTISGVLSRLEKRKFIDRIAGTEDQRERWIHLTEQGHAVLARAEKAALRLLARGLQNFKSDDARRFVELWEYYAGLKRTDGCIALASATLCKPVTDAGLRARCRAFVYEERVRQGLLQHAPSEVAPEGNKLFALLQGESIIGVLDLKNGEALHALIAGQVSPEIANRFLTAARELNQAAIIIPERHASENLRKLIRRKA